MASGSINDHWLKAYFDALPDSMFDVAKQAVAGAVANTQKTVKRNKELHRRSGELMRSIHTKVSGDTFQTLSGSVHSVGVPYAAIHEAGGTIKAKNAYKGVQGGPYLNIPLPNNKTAAGVMKKTAKQVFMGGGSMFKSKKGNYIVVNKIGTTMFVLKKEVTIPARLGMQKAAEDEIPLLMQRLRDALQGAIE